MNQTTKTCVSSRPVSFSICIKMAAFSAVFFHLNNLHWVGSMDWSAALILASLFFLSANVSCCKFSPAGRCVKTHEFTEDFSVMAGLPREEEVDCPEGRDRCMTGQHQGHLFTCRKRRSNSCESCGWGRWWCGGGIL